MNENSIDLGGIRTDNPLTIALWLKIHNLPLTPEQEQLIADYQQAATEIKPEDLHEDPYAHLDSIPTARIPLFDEWKKNTIIDGKEES